MSSLLVGLLVVLLVPLFVATWRTSLFGLALQGLLLAAIAEQGMPEGRSIGDWITLVDLGLVRGVAAPLVLHRVLVRKEVPPRSDVVPPNLLSWTFALGLVLVAFRLAERLEPAAGASRTLVAVSGAGALLAMFVLASQTGVVSQVIGALRLENAIALLEVGAGDHHAPIGLHVAKVAIVILTVALFRGYVERLVPAPPPDAAGPPEPSGPPEPTL